MNWGTLSKAFGNSRGKDGPTDSQRKKNDFGLHTLVAKDKEAPKCIDIVALPGLNGHFLHTWTDPKTGFNWLTEVIPQVAPTARVMSFWYNSMLQFSKSTSGISVFGQQLLESISAERRTEAEQEWPIIVICHSLGGLVLGRFIFGTPHGGSSLAPWASIMAGLLKLATLGASTNTQLSMELCPKSDELDRLSGSFKDMCFTRDYFKIISFYETCKMDYLNSLVVDQSSATLHIRNETAIPLDGDHRDICRFSDEKEKRLTSIKERLVVLAREALKEVTSSKTAFISALNTASYEAHRNRNPPPVRGTCTWIFNHACYKTWLESKDMSLLWISADPGCGKSVLASFLIDRFVSSPPQGDLNVCYFFFKSDNLEQGDAAYAARALLHQLYKQQPPLVEVGMHQLHRKDIEDPVELLKTFIHSVEDERCKDTLCVIDGLDECEPRSRAVLLHVLSDLCVDPGATPKLKILVTSRPENQVRITFERRQKQAGAGAREQRRMGMIRLRGEDETDAISEDITVVVRDKIGDLVAQGLPVELLAAVEAELIRRADRTFLWVSLVLSLLEEKVEEGASRRELDAILRTRDIYGVYQQLLFSRSGSSTGRKMLSIILGATRALTVEELCIALAVTPETNEVDPAGPATPLRSHYRPLRPGKTTFDHILYDLVSPFENRIKSLCGHFTRIIRTKVYLVHETARDFLLSHHESEESLSLWSLPSLPRPPTPTEVDSNQADSSASLAEQHHQFQHSFTLKDSHKLLLGICVTYIYCLEKECKYLSQNKVGRSSALDPFLEYAAKSWFIHFRRVSSQINRRDLPYYHNICHPDFPGFERWIGAFWGESHDVAARASLNTYLLGGANSRDALQDYYVNYFMLDVVGDHHDDDSNKRSLDGPKHDSDSSDDGGDGDNTGGEAMDRWQDIDQLENVGYNMRGKRIAKKEPAFNVLELAVPLSSPDSLATSYFPLRVDETGFVELDFGAGPSNKDTTTAAASSGGGRTPVRVATSKKHRARRGRADIKGRGK